MALAVAASSGAADYSAICDSSLVFLKGIKTDEEVFVVFFRNRNGCGVYYTASRMVPP